MHIPTMHFVVQQIAAETHHRFFSPVMALRMAREVGINACEARIMNDAQHFPIALVRRFDRTRADRSARVPFISALTFLGLEGGNPVGTYEDIAMQMRAHAHDARAQMSELYRRKV
jgi:serine/threonine-protein kinase HipA